jgi:ribosomal protein S18 acetylase RimI-like enzyme
MRQMVESANLMVTASAEGRLLGVARSLTDFSYACYLSDLAVDKEYQRLGIGKMLIAKTQDALGSRCKIILLSAPAATEYYPRLGFEKLSSAWVLAPSERIVTES